MHLHTLGYRRQMLEKENSFQRCHLKVPTPNPLLYINFILFYSLLLTLSLPHLITSIWHCKQCKLELCLQFPSRKQNRPRFPQGSSTLFRSLKNMSILCNNFTRLSQNVFICGLILFIHRDSRSKLECPARTQSERQNHSINWKILKLGATLWHIMEKSIYSYEVENAENQY